MNGTDLSQEGVAKSVVVGVGLTVAGVFGTVVGGFIAGFLLVLSGSSLSAPVAGAFLTVVVEVMYLVVGVAYVGRTRIEVPWGGLSAKDLRRAVGGYLVAIVFVILVFLGIEAVGLSIEPRFDPGESDISLVQNVLTSVTFVVVAVSEEYLFRGAIQRRLELGLGDRGGLLIASLLFGSIHVFNYQGDATAVLLAVLALSGVGAVVGYLYQQTDNLTVPIAVHYGYNQTLFVLLALGFSLT